MYTKFIFLTGILFDVIITLIGVLIRGGKEGNIFLKDIQPTNFMMFLFLASNLFVIPIALMIINKRKNMSRFWIMAGIYRFFAGMTWFI